MLKNKNLRNQNNKESNGQYLSVSFNNDNKPTVRIHRQTGEKIINKSSKIEDNIITTTTIQKPAPQKTRQRPIPENTSVDIKATPKTKSKIYDDRGFDSGRHNIVDPHQFVKAWERAPPKTYEKNTYSVSGGGIQISSSGRLVSFDDLEEKSVDDELKEPSPVQLKAKLNKKPGYNPRCRRSRCSSHSSTSLSSVSRETSLSPVTTSYSGFTSKSGSLQKSLQISPVKIDFQESQVQPVKPANSVSTHTQYTPPRLFSSIPIVSTSPKLPKRPNQLQVHTQTIQPKFAERSSLTDHPHTIEKACSPIKQPTPPKIYVVPSKPKTSEKSCETNFERKIRTKIDKNKIDTGIDNLGDKLGNKLEAKLGATLQQNLGSLESKLESKLNTLHTKLNSIDSSIQEPKKQQVQEKPSQFCYNNPVSSLPRANYNYSTAMYIDHSPPRIIATRTEEGAVFGLSSRQIIKRGPNKSQVPPPKQQSLNPVITPYTDSSKTQIYVPPPPRDFSHLSNLDDNGTIYSAPQKTMTNPEHGTYYAKPAKTDINKLTKPATDVQVSFFFERKEGKGRRGSRY